ncbi:MAG: hypothetical protein ACRYFW_06370 [Janthinobacterium lividum]
MARYATSEKARVDADAAAGVTGDPFAPIKSERDASITPKRETFGYRGIAKVLSADLPLLARVHVSDDSAGLKIRLAALVRRGGTDTNTDGYHERVIRTSRIEEIDELSPGLALDRVGDVAKRRADDAGEARPRGQRLTFV